MKGLRKILQLSWTAKKTNEWVLSKAGVKTETVEARILAYYGRTRNNATRCTHAGEGDDPQPGWTTSRRSQDSPWKSQSE